MVGFAYLGYSAKEQNRKNELYLYIALDIVSTFIKIAFGQNNLI
jgi:hypothetical protein